MEERAGKLLTGPGGADQGEGQAAPGEVNARLRITYHEYEYRCDMSHNDWALTPVTGNHIMADNALDAADLLRADHRGRIEIASIEPVCKADIKK